MAPIAGNYGDIVGEYLKGWDIPDYQLIPQNLKDGGIAGLLPSVILPGVQHTSPEVRNLAVKCLGLYCLLGLEEAKSHMMLLLQIIANDRDTIKLTAIKIVIDFIMTFGYSPFQDADLEELMVRICKLHLSPSVSGCEPKPKFQSD